MPPAWRNLFYAFACTLVFLLPAAGLILMGLLYLTEPLIQVRWRGWVLVWLPFTLLAGLPVLLTGESDGLLWAVTHGASGLIASIVLRASPRQILQGGLAALTVLGVISAGDRYLSARTWYEIQGGTATIRGLNVHGSIEEIHGTGGNDAVSRSWQLGPNVHKLTFLLDIKRAFDPKTLSTATSRSENVGEPTFIIQILGTALGPRPVAEFTLAPTADWQSHKFDFKVPLPHDGLEVQARPVLQSGESLLIRSVRLMPSSATHPIPTRPRQQLWFGNFNFLGHSSATGGALMASISHVPAIQILGLAVAIPPVLYSGSRTAILALAAALIIFALGRMRRPVRWLIASLSIIALPFFIPVLGSALEGMRLNEEVSRLDIWRAGLEIMRMGHPLVGSGMSGASTLLQQALGGVSVAHAHNLWIQFSISLGIFGLMASLWLTGTLVLIGWVRGGWSGLLLVLPVLLLQTFDVSLFFAGVLYPLLLGLNGLPSKGSPRPTGKRADPNG